MKRLAATVLVLALIALSSVASAGRYIPGNALRVGVRNAGMGGNHIALSGHLAQALINPAGILLDRNSTQFGAEGFVTDGPEFDTRGGRNRLRSETDNPPLFLGFSTTYAEDYAFALFDALRYNAHFTGSLGALDDPRVAIADYEEDTRLNTTGFAAAVRVRPRVVVGLGLYLDRQKTFKRADYVSNDTIPDLDFEAFGTANTLHGALGLIWSPKGKTTYALSFLTQADLENNVTLHTFRVGFVDSTNNNSFFNESFPVSSDAFPWSVTIGVHRPVSDATDAYADVSYVNWGVEANRNGELTVAAGGEWRAGEKGTLRAGFYTQSDPSEYDVIPGATEEDRRLFDLRSATASAYSDKNSEVFLAAGGGYRMGSFSIDLSIEDSHLISDYGRTLVKIGLTGRLLNNL